MAHPSRRTRSLTTFVARFSVAALVGVTLTACLGPARPDPSRLEGRGVEVLDATPPPGAEVYDRPRWQVGDRFIVRQGGRELTSFLVESIDDGSITIRSEEEQASRILDLDLGELRWQRQGSDEVIEFDPVDKRFSWPLWVGKRWRSHYLKKRPGDVLPILAHYHCDAIEQVTVPTGTYAALRIWCRSRPDIDGDFEERVDVLWYAPEVGRVVRKLQSARMTELVSLETAAPDDR